MQMIEIAKAFSYDAKIVIMDEPTSSLTEKEVNHLFKIINKLKEKGAASSTSPTRWKRSSSSVTRSPYCGMASGWRPSPSRA
jgi:ABC-type histidine transport system ATPase subunit